MLFSKLSAYKVISLVIVIVFGLHLLVLSTFTDSVFSNKIIESYLINYLTALFLYYIIDKHKAKFKDNIGFIFMLSSFLKFGLYFIFINPAFKIDGITTKLEFATFFIPYSICLFLETYALIKLLNELDYET